MRRTFRRCSPTSSRIRTSAAIFCEGESQDPGSLPVLRPELPRFVWQSRRSSAALHPDPCSRRRLECSASWVDCGAYLDESARNIDGSAATNLARVHIQSGERAIATINVTEPGKPQSYDFPMASGTSAVFNVVVETSRGKMFEKLQRGIHYGRRSIPVGLQASTPFSISIESR